MTTVVRPVSVVREVSHFRSPPVVRVLADPNHVGEALDLMEALEVRGVIADVRLGEDITASTSAHPDAVVVDVGGATGELADHCRTLSRRPVVVAVAEADDWEGRERARAAGYDLIITRPLDAGRLLERLEERLPGMRA